MIHKKKACYIFYNRNPEGKNEIFLQQNKDAIMN